MLANFQQQHRAKPVPLPSHLPYNLNSNSGPTNSRSSRALNVSRLAPEFQRSQGVHLQLLIRVLVAINAKADGGTTPPSGKEYTPMSLPVKMDFLRGLASLVRQLFVDLGGTSFASSLLAAQSHSVPLCASRLACKVDRGQRERGRFSGSSGLRMGARIAVCLGTSSWRKPVEPVSDRR